MENKFKHNKKRNTAFLYECLIRELTKTLLEKNDSRRNEILMIMKEYFSQETNLSKDLKIYRSFEENSIEEKYLDKFLNELKLKHLSINKIDLFNEQTSLINTINKNLGFSVYNNFVSNYKTLATIHQIFNESTPLKQKIVLEESLKSFIVLKEQTKQEKLIAESDAVVYKTFVEKFNKQYNDKLLKEQKNLLSSYMNSSFDNALELKVFLNEEISRLKNIVTKSLNTNEIKNDKDLFSKVKQLKEYLTNFKNEQINEESLSKILKIQQFAYEVNLND